MRVDHTGGEFISFLGLEEHLQDAGGGWWRSVFSCRSSEVIDAEFTL